ncbi:MAG: radical SAM protein [Gammaproteobacteria bacterium]
MQTANRIPVYGVFNNHDYSPLALGMVVSAARAWKDGALDRAFEFVPDLVTGVDAARRLIDAHGPGVFLGSNYLWSSEPNLQVAKFVKDAAPGSVVIVGGPSVPKYDYACQEFFAAHPYVDVAVRGEGEATFPELLDRIAALGGTLAAGRDSLADVAGITYRPDGAVRSDEVVRTAERDRIVDLNALPSPYLNGWFDGMDTGRWVSAVVETNRGCPYACAFCDWGSATLSKIRHFDLERVKAEIDWIGRNRVNVLWIADANFGIFERDVEITQFIADTKLRHGYPRQLVVNYAKHSTERLAVIIRILYSAGVAADSIIAIQTHDPQTLKAINRSNIKTKRYEELIAIFRKEQLPVTSDLMIGLPGATVASFKADLQFFFDRKCYAKAYPTLVLPNSPMAHRDYMEKHQIKVDAGGYIVSTSSYTRLDRWNMQAIYQFYRLLVGYSLLKYFLYHLQMDHGVQALDFIEALQREFNEEPDRLPETALVADPMIEKDPERPWAQLMHVRTEADWARFHDEIAGFTARYFGVQRDSAMNAVLRAQALLMPRLGRPMPSLHPVEHDVASYFASMRGAPNITVIEPAGWKRLVDYGPASLRVEDPVGLCRALDDQMMYDDHRIVWELQSGLSFAQGVDALVSVEGRPAGELRALYV